MIIALVSPILVALAVMLRLGYGSPVLFRQQRVGRDGKQFTLFKFRTMRRNAEEVLASNPELYREYVRNNYKLPLGEDVRVTRLGRFLRVSSLDELPQLFNVLRGEMSLVGPRPVVPEEVEKFGSFAPLILSMQPGLTGLWQVNGRSLIGDYEQRVRLNVEYIRDGSILRDFTIIAKTLLVVLRIKDAGWERETADVMGRGSSGIITKQQAGDSHAATHQLPGRYQFQARPKRRPVWPGRSVPEAHSSYQPRSNRPD